MKEKYLLSGSLEETNEPYAIAKIAGIKMCESYNFQYRLNYKCLMPTNTFGPNDNYDINNSHFLPALLRKIIIAKRTKKKSITLWGTGKIKREVIYVDDIADAVVFFMNKSIKETFLNIGSGIEMSVLDYAEMIKKKIYPELKIKFDNNNKMDGVKRKVMDSSLARKYGWTSKTKINDAIDLIYKEIKNKEFDV